MCMSRYHRVVTAGAGSARVEDALGRCLVVSLLAFDGPEPRPGEWIVVHSGYALGPADPEEAGRAVAELRAAGRAPDR